MKTQIQDFAFLVFAVLAISGQTLLADSRHTHIYVEVKGMACPFCVQGLEKQLKKNRRRGTGGDLPEKR